MARQMTDEQKARKAEYMKAYRQNDCYREKQRQRAAAWRMARTEEEHKRWLDETREYRKQKKAKYRALAGCKPRELIASEAEKRRAAKAAAVEQRRQAMAEFKAQFVGPPSPKSAMNSADYYRWRYSNDPEFMARELDRAQVWKTKTRTGYKASPVKWADVPPVVMEVKRLMYVINKQLERKDNEVDQ